MNRLNFQNAIRWSKLYIWTNLVDFMIDFVEYLHAYGLCSKRLQPKETIISLVRVSSRGHEILTSLGEVVEETLCRRPRRRTSDFLGHNKLNQEVKAKQST